MSPMEHSEANFITQRKPYKKAAAAVWILFRALDSSLLLLPGIVACREADQVACNLNLRPTSFWCG